jgi:hypothetical protein
MNGIKPYVARVLSRRGKTLTVPMPGKYREIYDAVKHFGIKTEADEAELYVIGYRTFFVPVPDIGHDTQKDIERTADALAKLDEEQVRAIGLLCRRFYLRFSDIWPLLCLIHPEPKEDDDCENL